MHGIKVVALHESWLVWSPAFRRLESLDRLKPGLQATSRGSAPQSFAEKSFRHWPLFDTDSALISTQVAKPVVAPNVGAEHETETVIAENR
jgi:hypothetical protein